MQQEAHLPTDKIWLEQVIISTIRRRGRGLNEDDPIRIITQVFTTDGKLIAEYDPLPKPPQKQ